MSNKEKMEKLAEEKFAAYNKWLKGAVESLSDGEERNVRDDEDGLSASLDDGCEIRIPCVVDKVKYNISHSEIRCHLKERDYVEADEWVSIYDLASEDFDSVCEHIVWED